MPVDALNSDMVNALASLDDEEVETLVAVRRKLNDNLSDKLKKAADTVGGFVW